jgi:hypothetical protein
LWIPIAAEIWDQVAPPLRALDEGQPFSRAALTEPGLGVACAVQRNSLECIIWLGYYVPELVVLVRLIDGAAF